MNKTKHQPYIDLVSNIDAELTRLEEVKGFGPDDLKENFENLMQLSKLLSNGETYGLMEFGLDYLKDRPFRTSGKPNKRETNPEKLDRIRTQWAVAKNKTIKDPNGPIAKCSSQKGRRSRKKELLSDLGDEFAQMPLDTLRDNFLELLIEYEIANQIVKGFQEEIDFLTDTLTIKYLKSREKAVDHQVGGKKIKNQHDIDCKTAGLNLLKKSIGRPLVGSDFTRYVVTMEDERLIPKNREKSEWAKKDEWPLASLRVFFEENTGLIATWSKAEAARIRNESNETSPHSVKTRKPTITRRLLQKK
jgi:uncharacterized protein YihD (DUF1040 family)